MLKNCKISDYKIKKILKCFCGDINATKTAQILELNRRTIDRYFNIFRKKIIENLANLNWTKVTLKPVVCEGNDGEERPEKRLFGGYSKEMGKYL